jgi:CRP/FNR family transcriptional regulator, cyclic AMP receptor protein
MSKFEAAGYLASSLVFAAFCMEGIVRLRAVALASNVAFIVYSIGFGLAPIFLLHAALLPVNTWRLWQAVRAEHRRQMTHTSELRQGVRP